ncbi:hypothetical protein ACLOJK_004122 [Asimina triloba]
MGILPCAIACTQSKSNIAKEDPNSSSSSSQSRSHSHSHVLEYSSNSSSLASQSSLPSVPSLTSPTPTTATTVTAHHRCIATLKGHSSYVFSLAITAQHLYSGSSDGEIRCWPPTIDAATAAGSTNSIIITPPGKSAVKSILASADNLLFNAHQDHRIRVWKIIDIDHKLLVTLPTVTDRILRFLPPKNHVQVRRHKKRTWVHHVDAVSALALSPDAALLYSVSWDRTLKIWRTSDFRCLESVANAHDDAINAVAVSADGFVYTASADMKIKVWRRDKTHSLVSTLEKHRSAVNALALSSDGSILYSGACDRSIVVWERSRDSSSEQNHMAVVGAVRGHGKAILCLAAADDDVVCSGSADKTVRVWRRCGEEEKRFYTCLAVLEGHGGPVKCLAVSSNRVAMKIYSGSLDCDIKVWQLVYSSSIEEERRRGEED